MSREALLAGFARGGTWETRAPGPELAAALATAAGSEWRCRGASGEQLIGVLGRLAALESWAAAGKLGVLRALIRDDDPAFLGGSRHGDLPDVWDDGLTAEIALALAASAPSADKTMRSAWELGARLPEINTLLETGVLDAPKARLIAEVFQDLSDENAGRAEALIVPELTEPPAKTYAQVEHIATAIALTVDPRLGERRRKAAEKHAARVQMFRERAGTAGLSGRDLPTDQTLAANANLNARAAQYKDSGVFAKARMDQLRAAAYLDLLNGVTAEDRIAHGLLTEQSPADDQTDADPAPAGEHGPTGGPRPGGDDCPCPECDGTCLPEDDSSPDDDGPDDNGPTERRTARTTTAPTTTVPTTTVPTKIPVTTAPAAVTPAKAAPVSAAAVTVAASRPAAAPATVTAPAMATALERVRAMATAQRAAPAAATGAASPLASLERDRRRRLPHPGHRRADPARRCMTSSSRWPRCSAWPTGPAKATASAPSTPAYAGPSPPPQRSAPAPPSASPSPAPTASPSATAAPNPAGPPPLTLDPRRSGLDPRRSGPAPGRAPRPAQHHRHRRPAARAGRAVADRLGARPARHPEPATTAGRPGLVRHLGADPARRPKVQRAAGAGAHVRVRSSA